MGDTGGMETEDTAVQDFLQILEEHRKNCERQGKYVEAEIAKNRLEELRQHEENRRREAMRSRQIAERLGVEEAHMLEFQQFNALWDKRMAEFEQKSADLEEAMKERHGTELMEYIRNAQSEPLRKPKFSKELLNLRKIQQTLAKQKEYAEAHKIKLKADNLEAFELEKMRNQHQMKLSNVVEKFKAKQTSELQALRKRVQTGREEQKKQRQLDLERLLQRYQNVKSELESQQNIERIRAEKFMSYHLTSKGSPNASVNNSMREQSR
mmetsp:Transcript_10597/g.20948  ORF Transcript_10597/g.20948 Transcript_10597/m.20948 type:complete len:267 (+) Transcript_10597:77-877(+)|eukprot:CAMPEP_0173377922 /NCGR_PEP_ID=MMETSP1356-20130122/1187_1 /TAXON_ID=77927 ORGANISM="Hemiselmis virescens, Strain PCC157" /NCGR_SAMPLE_ID=MMETSP1356 /ASSEMBLY_ACC=CAM_ASM_000847 /LENGTH=266 /DNA_ID=CAMNT_0014330839 /DNA_START=89 /DNA_END=889 /DNA_ORIENTATION=-